MARGIIGGMVFGGAVSVAAAAGISILLDPPTRPEVIAEVPNPEAAPAERESQAEAGFGDADLVTESSDAPGAVPKPEDASAALRASDDTPRVPETGAVETPSFSNGTSTSETALSALPQDQPVLQAPQAAPPVAPGAEAELSISTEPAQPPAPKVDDPLENLEAGVTEAPSAPETPAVAETEAGVASAAPEEADPAQDVTAALEAPSSDVAPEADAPAAVPERDASVEDGQTDDRAAPSTQAPDVARSAADEAEDAVTETEVAAIAQPEETEAGTLPAVDAESAEPVPQTESAEVATPEPAPETPEETAPTVVAEAPEEPAPQVVLEPSAPSVPTVEPETPTAPEPEVAEETPGETAPSVVAEEPESDGSEQQIAQARPAVRPSIGRPASSIINREQSSDEEAPIVEAPAAAPDGPPISAYSARFENPDEKPLMSIVLIDGATDLANADTGLTALQSFPYPLSFAVDATAPDAQERMTAYRNAGFEVLALMNLPVGATPQDAAVNLDAALDAVPQAVALIEGPGSGLQTSSEVTDQLISSLKQSGHGIVLQAKGLNSAQRDAEREGVPAQIVFRDFDSAGQDARTIRRFLDQAAFRAGQEGGVIMMGRLRADTISALLIWGNQDRARRVALSPVSAVLTK